MEIDAGVLMGLGWAALLLAVIVWSQLARHGHARANWRALQRRLAGPLAEHARAAGWQIGDGCTLGLAEVAERVVALCGAPPRGELVSERSRPLTMEMIGAVLLRQGTRGPEIGLEHWWLGRGGPPRVLMACAVMGSASPAFVMDDEVCVEGALPAALAPTWTAARTLFPRHARLCCRAGWLALSVEAPALTPKLAVRLETLVHALAAQLEGGDPYRGSVAAQRASLGTLASSS